jgi:hypothetical protein
LKNASRSGRPNAVAPGVPALPPSNRAIVRSVAPWPTDPPAAPDTVTLSNALFGTSLSVEKPATSAE